MNSPYDTAEAVGCPIRKSSDLAPARGSPRLIAACYVLHRLSMPRHPPNALTCLIPHTQCGSRKNGYSEIALLPCSPLVNHERRHEQIATALNSQTAGRLLKPSGRQILTFANAVNKSARRQIQCRRFEFMKIQSTVRSSNTPDTFFPTGNSASLESVRFAFLFTMYRALPAP